MKVTHYWSVIKPSIPPCIYAKCDDGKIRMGYWDGEKLGLAREVKEPQPIIGFHPETGEYGFRFGHWVPIERF